MASAKDATVSLHTEYAIQMNAICKGRSIRLAPKQRKQNINWRKTRKMPLD
jgi:hypothetical protein